MMVLSPAAAISHGALDAAAGGAGREADARARILHLHVVAWKAVVDAQIGLRRVRREHRSRERKLADLLFLLERKGKEGAEALASERACPLSPASPLKSPRLAPPSNVLDHTCCTGNRTPPTPVPAKRFAITFECNTEIQRGAGEYEVDPLSVERRQQKLTQELARAWAASPPTPNACCMGASTHQLHPVPVVITDYKGPHTCEDEGVSTALSSQECSAYWLQSSAPRAPCSSDDLPPDTPSLGDAKLFSSPIKFGTVRTCCAEVQGGSSNLQEHVAHSGQLRGRPPHDTYCRRIGSQTSRIDAVLEHRKRRLHGLSSKQVPPSIMATSGDGIETLGASHQAVLNEKSGNCSKSAWLRQSAVPPTSPCDRYDPERVEGCEHCTIRQDAQQAAITAHIRETEACLPASKCPSRVSPSSKQAGSDGMRDEDSPSNRASRQGRFAKTELREDRAPHEDRTSQLRKKSPESRAKGGVHRPRNDDASMTNASKSQGGSGPLGVRLDLRAEERRARRQLLAERYRDADLAAQAARAAEEAKLELQRVWEKRERALAVRLRREEEERTAKRRAAAKAKIELAILHANRSLMRRIGWRHLRTLLLENREREGRAMRHWCNGLYAEVFQVWGLQVARARARRGCEAGVHCIVAERRRYFHRLTHGFRQLRLGVIQQSSRLAEARRILFYNFLQRIFLLWAQHVITKRERREAETLRIGLQMCSWRNSRLLKISFRSWMVAVDEAKIESSAAAYKRSLLSKVYEWLEEMNDSRQ